MSHQHLFESLQSIILGVSFVYIYHLLFQISQLYVRDNSVFITATLRTLHSMYCIYIITCIATADTYLHSSSFFYGLICYCRFQSNVTLDWNNFGHCSPDKYIAIYLSISWKMSIYTLRSSIPLFAISIFISANQIVNVARVIQTVIYCNVFTVTCIRFHS